MYFQFLEKKRERTRSWPASTARARQQARRRPPRLSSPKPNTAAQLGPQPTRPLRPKPPAAQHSRTRLLRPFLILLVPHRSVEQNSFNLQPINTSKGAAQERNHRPHLSLSRATHAHNFLFWRSSSWHTVQFNAAIQRKNFRSVIILFPPFYVDFCT
jgi:hypothetical protein